MLMLFNNTTTLQKEMSHRPGVCWSHDFTMFAHKQFSSRFECLFAKPTALCKVTPLSLSLSLSLSSLSVTLSSRDRRIARTC